MRHLYVPKPVAVIKTGMPDVIPETETESDIESFYDSDVSMYHPSNSQESSCDGTEMNTSCEEPDTQSEDYVPDSHDEPDTRSENYVPDSEKERGERKRKASKKNQLQVPEGDAEDVGETSGYQPRKRLYTGKHVYTDQEKAAIERCFHDYLNSNESKMPGKAECLTAQKKEPCLAHLDWTKLKFFVYNKHQSLKRIMLK